MTEVGWCEARESSARLKLVAKACLDLDVNTDPCELGYTGVGVRTQPNGLYVWVVRTLVNWRVMECDEHVIGRYWCYPGAHIASFTVALRNAALYEDDGEPGGWVKSWDGRRNDLSVGAWETEMKNARSKR